MPADHRHQRGLFWAWHQVWIGEERIGDPWLLYGAMLVYGFGHGGLFTVVSPTVAEYFGLRAHGAIFGLILFCGTIGGAIGPVLAGRVFDVTGSYDWAFICLAVLVSLGLLLVLKLPVVSSFAKH